MPPGGWRRRWWAIPAAISLMVLSAALAGCGGGTDAPVVVRVTPHKTLDDQPVDITVSGLDPHQLATLSLSATDSQNFVWDGHARFKANSQGVIDLDHAPAISGDYRGVHGMGLLAGMQPAQTSNTDSLFSWNSSQPTPFTLSVTVGTKVVAHTTFQRLGGSRGITTSGEYSHGFYGQMWWPKPGAPRHAAVLEFGGSEGGLSGALPAADLASAGYPTLDLAYFKEPGLPSTLSRIPLSYFAKALRWLAKQPGINPRRIWVMGGSRGGEPALLLAAHYPKLVYGVVANTAADVAVCGLPGCSTPAWTYKGMPVTYSPLAPYVLARLPVGNIKGPVLLDCGTHDEVWGRRDGCGMAAKNMAGLARDPSPHQLYRFVGGGHWVNNVVPFEPSSRSYVDKQHVEGVNQIANSNADAILWPRLLAFLAHPGKTGTYSFNVS